MQILDYLQKLGERQYTNAMLVTQALYPEETSILEIMASKAPKLPLKIITKGEATV